MADVVSWPDDVTRADLEVSFFRSTGAGGQNVNKRDTACRIVHLPTKIAAECRAHREQGQNKREAFKKLAAKLVPIMREHLRPPDQKSMDTKVIRSYCLDDHRVKDLRLPGHVWHPDNVLDGDALAEIHHLVLLTDTE